MIELLDEARVRVTGRTYPNVIVIGDVHGSLANLRDVLSAAGLIGADDAWTGGRTHLIQTGDVIDRGPESEACVRMLTALREQARPVGGRVDLLVGNHELALVSGDLSMTNVADAESLAQQLRQSIVRGRMHAARAYHHYLITHAGVCPSLMGRLIHELCAEPGAPTTVAAIARHLNRILREAVAHHDYSHPIFHCGPARGGADASGGIFWADFDAEQGVEISPLRVWQVFGHTPPFRGQTPFRVLPEFRCINVDVGMAEHYGGYLGYARLLRGRVLGMHCDADGVHEEVLAATRH